MDACPICVREGEGEDDDCDRAICMSYSTLAWCGVVATTMLPTGVSSGNERAGYYYRQDCIMSIGPGDGDGCPYRIPYFLFCVLDMMILFLGWYGMYLMGVGMGADL